MLVNVRVRKHTRWSDEEGIPKQFTSISWQIVHLLGSGSQSHPKTSCHRVGMMFPGEGALRPPPRRIDDRLVGKTLPTMSWIWPSWRK